MQAYQSNRGFTLIELSIVLVILGLLVSGVLVGKELIRAAELRAQLRQFDQFAVSVNLFREKYRCTPGDCAKARQYWPDATDGDGNGRLTNGIGAPDVDTSFDGELPNFFSQLSSSGLVKEQFDRTPVIRYGFPETVGARGKGIVAAGDYAPDYGTTNCADYFQRDDCGIVGWNVGLFAAFGNPSVASSLWTAANDEVGLFTPVETFDMDRKADDGLPRSGRFQAFRPYDSVDGDCLTTSDQSAEYLLTTNEPTCQVGVNLQ